MLWVICCSPPVIQTDPPIVRPLPTPPNEVPQGQGGGGVAWIQMGTDASWSSGGGSGGGTGGGSGSGGGGMLIARDPGGIGGGGFGVGGPGNGVVPGAGSGAGAGALAVVGGPAPGVLATEGPRAVGIAAAMIGALLLTSALVWALYQFKPGVIPALASAKGAGGVSVGSPIANDYQLVGGYGMSTVVDSSSAAAAADDPSPASESAPVIQESQFNMSNMADANGEAVGAPLAASTPHSATMSTQTAAADASESHHISSSVKDSSFFSSSQSYSEHVTSAGGRVEVGAGDGFGTVNR